MQFHEFASNVEAWAKARKIIPNATPTAQLLKAASEAGELADAVNKREQADAADAIGDVTVCLVNFAALDGLDILDAYTEAKRFGLTDDESAANCVFSIMATIASMADEHMSRGIKQKQLAWALQALFTVSHHSGLDFAECCAGAWNEIKDRRGELCADGVFVKEA